MKMKTKEPASTNQSVATANDWPQHAASCHILSKLAAITIKVGALLQDEGPWFFTLFSREEPPFSRLARPLQHQGTLFNWGDAKSEWAKEGGSFEECDAAKPRWKEGPSKNVMPEGGSFEECDAAKPRKNVMRLTQVLNAQNTH